MRVRKCEIPYLFRPKIVWVACAYTKIVSFISRSQYCNQRGRGDSRSSSLFFPLTPTIQLELARLANERGAESVSRLKLSLIKTTRAHFENEKRLLDRIRL